MALVKEVKGSIIGQIPNGGKVVQAQMEDDEFDIDKKIKKASQLLDDFKELTVNENQEETV